MVFHLQAFSKSANYCYAGMSHNQGVLLLCEIAAQPFLELNGSDYHADAACKNAGKMYVFVFQTIHMPFYFLMLTEYSYLFLGDRATKGVGITQPAGWQDCGEALDHEELKGVVMPKGALANVSPPGAYLQYNEVRFLRLYRVGETAHAHFDSLISTLSIALSKSESDISFW